MLPGRFRAVRMCEGVQTDNAGEIVRLDQETQRKRGQRKIKKEGGQKRKKKIQESIQTKPTPQRLAP